MNRKNFARIGKIMLPKDYINYCLTGVHSTDFSDASGTLLLECKNKRWSREMLALCGVRERQMPRLFESYDCVGTVKPEIAALLASRRPPRWPPGPGTTPPPRWAPAWWERGGCNISLGTSGTVFISSERFGVDRNNALHAFAHATAATT